MAKAKPNQKFHIDKLNTALDKLDQLESKPVEELTLRESVYFMRDKLNSALKKGYNYEDLSEILAEQEILVSASTLKLYLTDSSKKSKSRIKKSKSATNSASVSKSSPQSNSGSITSKLSTNITDSKEELGISNSETEINSMEDSTNSERAVNLNSTTGTKSSTANSKKAKAQPLNQSSGSKSSSTKTNVLSGRSDDLESEFNSF